MLTLREIARNNILFGILFKSVCFLYERSQINFILISSVCKLFSPSLDLFSEKAESKTKKRKVTETSVTDKLLLDETVNDKSEVKDDDNLSKEDDVDPLAEGWEASAILGATDVEGQVHFLIQW